MHYLGLGLGAAGIVYSIIAGDNLVLGPFLPIVSGAGFGYNLARVCQGSK